MNADDGCIFLEYIVGAVVHMITLYTMMEQSLPLHEISATKCSRNMNDKAASHLKIMML